MTMLLYFDFSNIIVFNNVFENAFLYSMKNLSDFSLNKQNPFLNQTLIQMGSALVSKKVMASNKDEGAVLKAMDAEGQILGNTVFMRNKTVDEEQFTKFFYAGFKAFYDLKPATIKVFGFIMNQLKPNSDEFLFFIEDCVKETKYSVATIYRALGELCAAEIIARGRDDIIYYINPMIIFNGDRVTFATTYINKNYPKYHTSQGHLKGTIDTMKEDGMLNQPQLPGFED